MLSRKEVHNALDTLLYNEAETIIKKAEEEGVTLRLLGSIAFRCHCPRYSHFHEFMNRKLTDIDFASYTRENYRVDKLLRELGYTTQSYIQATVATLGRSIYWKKENQKVKVDIFWDELKMNHNIEFRNRLELDNPTIPLSELLQEKLQIVKLNWKDVKDTVMLLVEHDVAEKYVDRETIDLSGIIKRASKDWGYYYTFTTNLKKIQGKILEIQIISDKERSMLDERILRIINAMEKVPKSIGWKMRSKIGPKKRWYNEVE